MNARNRIFMLLGILLVISLNFSRRHSASRFLNNRIKLGEEL